MNGISYAIGSYIGAIASAWRRGGIFAWMLIVTWFIYPFSARMTVYPGRVINLQNWLQGKLIIHLATNQELIVAEVTAVATLIAISLFQLGLTTLIYRRCRYYVSIWPLALLLVAGISNAIWYWRTGYFDLLGALLGATPFVAAVLWHSVCERLGADFVFGRDSRPDYVPGLD